ncbi:MAG: DUF4349 domain-containing protein [Anaerolineae bacterium]|nr:DUF4349 domain-containing protein [Anaerolineae bacterium]MBT7192088.1 DUF4349 domain-containing protein [Anaerolineae bacterium]MBT7990164.1 DUF4349 domain-containing protein [Anaerolineae bacterium]
MKTLSKITFVLFLVAAFVLVGCGGGAALAEEVPAPEYAAEEAPAVDLETVAESAPQAPSADGAEANVSRQSSGTIDVAAAAQRSTRKIIKNAEIKLLVEDSDVAIDRTTQIVGDVNAYIISSRIWYQPYAGDNYKYATITMGVPVDQFETAIRRLRAISVQVIDENASGEDVTDQFVDLQSQLDNLIATRDRIRTFLEQAKTVEESLRVSQELSVIEAQIEEIQGRMNYLKDRSAYSTITVNIEPELPEIIAPTPTPTAPPPTPEPWSPAKTLERSKKTLTITYQGFFELAIWLLVVVLPIFGPPIFIIWLIWRFFDKKKMKPNLVQRDEANEN